LIAGLLPGCAGNENEDIIHVTGAYAGALSQIFQDDFIAVHDTVALDLLQGGGTIEAFGQQIENRATGVYQTLTLETAVIAVDRDRTDAAIASWGDLSGCGAEIGIISAMPHARMIAAAICYGLEGENYTLDAAVKLLEPLHQKGLLKLDDAAAPIHICFDSEAAARIKGGENIEIIIPSDGTLTFEKGLLSNKILILPKDAKQIFIDSGLRWADGGCDGAIYPPAAQYAPAMRHSYSPTTAHYLLASRFGEITQDWARVLRRDVRHTRLYTSADDFEHVLFPTIFIIFAVIWAGSAMRRSQYKSTRRAILAMVALLVAWQLTRVLKYQFIDENTLTRYLWYGYYVFQSLLACCLVRVATLIGAGGDGGRGVSGVSGGSGSVSGVSGSSGAGGSGSGSVSGGSGGRLPKWFRAVFAANLLLAGLALTNDLHGMMFTLDIKKPGWSGDYGYGALYFVVMAALLLQLIGSIIIMFVKNKHNPRRFGGILPLALSAALITYIAGYVLRIPVFAESDLTMVICAFALIFFELCIRAGQIPVNTHYRGLFRGAGLNMQIMDMGGGCVYASDGFAPIDARTWEKLMGGGDPVQIDEDTLLVKNEISGGYAVWREDVSLINKIRAETAASCAEIEAANALLSREAKERGRDALIKTQVELYTAFEEDVAAYERQLAGLLSRVPAGEPERNAYMRGVAGLVCFIKRRCNFLALSLGGAETITAGEYMLYIDELSGLMRAAGIQCLTYCTLSAGIRLRRAMLFYELFYLTAEWALTNGGHGLVAQTLCEGGGLTMKLAASGNAMNFRLPERMLDEIRVANGIFITKELGEDRTGIFLSFKWENL